MSTSGSRRKFLKRIGSAAVVSALPRIAPASQASQAPSRSVVVFWEPGFPEIQGLKITRDILQQSLASFTVHFLSEQELIARLNSDRFDLFINPFGSAFPKRAWPELLKYLRGDGNWLNLGGVPLSRPVVRNATTWRTEPHQTTYHKRLGITQSFPVKNTGDPTTEEVYELYVRMSSTNTEPDEAGSDGPREAYLYPLKAVVYGGPGPKAASVIFTGSKNRRDS